MGNKSSKKDNQLTEREEVLIPFEYSDTGHQIVVLEYRDETIRMILDTAAGANVFSEKSSQRLGLSLLESEETVSGLGTKEHAIEKIEPIEVTFGKSNLLLENMLSMDLSHVEAAGGSEGIDGLLGSPFFRNYKARLDFEARMLTLVLDR